MPEGSGGGGDGGVEKRGSSAVGKRSTNKDGARRRTKSGGVDSSVQSQGSFGNALTVPNAPSESASASMSPRPSSASPGDVVIAIQSSQDPAKVHRRRSAAKGSAKRGSSSRPAAEASPSPGSKPKPKAIGKRWSGDSDATVDKARHPDSEDTDGVADPSASVDTLGPSPGEGAPAGVAVGALAASPVREENEGNDGATDAAAPSAVAAEATDGAGGAPKVGVRFSDEEKGSDDGGEVQRRVSGGSGGSGDEGMGKLASTKLMSQASDGSMKKEISVHFGQDVEEVEVHVLDSCGPQASAMSRQGSAVSHRGTKRKSRRYDSAGDDEEPEATTKVERVRRARMNMMRRAVTVKKAVDEGMSTDLSMASLYAGDDETKFEWQSLWRTTPADLSYLGVGVELYFRFLRLLGITFVVVGLITFYSSYLFYYGSMLSDENPLRNFFGRLSVGNLGSCGAKGCKSLADVRSRCLFEYADDCEKVSDFATYIDFIDSVAIVILILAGWAFRFVFIPVSVSRSSNDNESIREYSVMVTGLPRWLEGDEPSGAIYGATLDGRIVWQGIATMESTSPWEEIDFQGLPGGKPKSLDVFKDAAYVLSEDGIVYRSKIRKLKKWEAITHPPRGSTRFRNSCGESPASWEQPPLTGGSKLHIVDCLRIYKKFAYCIGPGQCILRMPLLETSGLGEWEQASRRGIISFCIDSGIVYAVDTYNCIVYQDLDEMTCYSHWRSAYNFQDSCCLCCTRRRRLPSGVTARKLSSICVAGDFLYVVDRTENRVYKQPLDDLTPESECWELCSEPGVLCISAPRETRHKTYAAKLSRHMLDVIKHKEEEDEKAASQHWRLLSTATSAASRSPSSPSGQKSSIVSVSVPRSGSSSRVGGSSTEGGVSSQGVGGSGSNPSLAAIRGKHGGGTNSAGGGMGQVSRAMSRGLTKGLTRGLTRGMSSANIRNLLNRRRGSAAAADAALPASGAYSGAPTANEAVIEIDRTELGRDDGANLNYDVCGIRVHPQACGLLVEDVYPDSVVDVWNRKHPDHPELQILPGNRIIGVNRVRVDPARMVRELNDDRPRFRKCPKCFTVWRRPQPRFGRCAGCSVDVEERDIVTIFVDRAIREVVLIKNLNGAVGKFMRLGKLRIEVANTEVLVEEAQKRYDSSMTLCRCWRWQKLRRMEGKLEELRALVYKLDQEVQEQVHDTDARRAVVFAFVTFSTQELRRKVLEEYRFSTYPWFSYLQNALLLFQGFEIKVMPAADPSNLYWENLDFPSWQRSLRKCCTFLATVIVLLVCAFLITLAQSTRQPEAWAPEYKAWVVQAPASGSNTSIPCLNVCDWTLFGTVGCSYEGGTSDQWPVANVFDATSDDVLGASPSWNAGQCGSRWASSGCSGSPGAFGEWLGIEFEEARIVKCMRLFQNPDSPVQSLKIWACPESPPPPEYRETWDPSWDCVAMDETRLTNELDKISDSVSSGDLKVVRDIECQLEDPSNYLPLQVAQQAAESSAEPALDVTVDCFCRQQLRLDPTFLAPGKLSSGVEVGVSAEFALCRPWALHSAKSTATLVLSLIAVVVLNFVLKNLFKTLTAGEKHFSQTALAKSQFLKLFSAQFINTGLIILLVHANIEGLPVSEAFSDLISFGRGRFYEPDRTWFQVVGTSISLTSALQIVSTTLPEILRAAFFRLCLFRHYARTRVTQEALNSKYLLPRWDLALRLAQGMNVICVIIMYSSGMPVLYAIGALYCFVAYWVDKWSLLRGCSRPPAYSETLIVSALSLQPVTIFCHVLFAAAVFSNQTLLPSGWSPWAGFCHWFFDMELADYEDAQDRWRTAYETESRKELYWDWLNSRLVDLGRSGTWRVVLILGFYAVYFVGRALYFMIFKPLVDPVFGLIKYQVVTRLAKMAIVRSLEVKISAWSGGHLKDPFHLHGGNLSARAPFVDKLPELESKGMLASYAMEANPAYAPAAAALRQANKDLKEAIMTGMRSESSIGKGHKSRRSIVGGLRISTLGMDRANSGGFGGGRMGGRGNAMRRHRSAE